MAKSVFTYNVLFIRNGILLAIICQLQGGKQTGPKNGDFQANHCQLAALGSFAYLRVIKIITYFM